MPTNQDTSQKQNILNENKTLETAAKETQNTFFIDALKIVCVIRHHLKIPVKQDEVF